RGHDRGLPELAPVESEANARADERAEASSRQGGRGLPPAERPPRGEDLALEGAELRARAEELLLQLHRADLDVGGDPVAGCGPGAQLLDLVVELFARLLLGSDAPRHVSIVDEMRSGRRRSEHGRRLDVRAYVTTG